MNNLVRSHLQLIEVLNKTLGEVMFLAQVEVEKANSRAVVLVGHSLLAQHINTANKNNWQNIVDICEKVLCDG